MSTSFRRGGQRLRYLVQGVAGGILMMAGAALASAQPLPAQAEGETAAKEAAPEAVPSLESLNQRLGKVETENRKLRETLESKEKAAAAVKPVTEWYEVGSDLKLQTRWDSGLWAETANKDFRIHIGGRLQYDTVFYHPSPGMNAPATPIVVPGTGLGLGIAPVDDGMFFRRIRLVTEGTLYEVVDWSQEVDFESANLVLFDDLWIGLRDLPWFGNLRLGQQKVPQGMESFSSSKFLPMLERSILFESFWQEFGLGVAALNSYCDDRLTSQVMFGRVMPFNPNEGAQFGDGTYSWTGRLTGLPVYEHEGRCLLHLGVSGQYRVADNARTANQTLPSLPPGTTDPRIIRFRTRPEIRDNGEALGNSVRYVDTGPIIADGVGTLGSELFFVHGEFSVQAEATVATAVNPVFPASTAGRPLGNQTFYGGYVLMSYFLTGENRTYDRKLGRYNRIIPNENFFVVRGAHDQVCRGWGAWELLYRYSRVDVDSELIPGGQMTGHTFGVNWYLNPNTKMQVNYLYTSRDVVLPANSGAVQVLGARVQVDF